MEKILLKTHTRGHYAYIDPDMVSYIAQEKNHCTIYLCNKKKYKLYRSMKSVFPLFPHLYRLTVSLAINTKHLTEIQNKEGRLVWLTFDGLAPVPTSRGEHYPSFITALSSNSGSGDEKGE